MIIVKKINVNSSLILIFGFIYYMRNE